MRDYNEDRVSIILNILKPPNKVYDRPWPQICFFGVFDGHGGVACADYLRDHLHNYIIQNERFPQDPEGALYDGFLNCENYFLQ
jgi:protein phosphatase PTC2/3